jgi:acyl dehydratase
MRFYEELAVGDQCTFDGEYLVTKEEIIEVGERWDPQPFHIDPIAAKDSIFGGLVASSAHIFSIYVSIGHTPIDEAKRIASVSALGFNNLQWHSPVRPNDVLRSSFEIIASRESISKPHLGVVTTRSRIFNQNDETVFTLECVLFVPKSAESTPA